MAEETKTQIGTNPFLGHIIAMKDVKDKKSRKGSLRPLFDCVEAINTAVDALQSFNESSPDDGDRVFIAKCLESLTNMQIKLLEMSQEKIHAQNSFENQMNLVVNEGSGMMPDSMEEEPTDGLEM
jgi:hypothetical protein